MTKEDNRVHDCQKIHKWKACTKPVKVVPQKFNYKQKKDDRGPRLKVFTHLGVCVGMFAVVFVTKISTSRINLRSVTL